MVEARAKPKGKYVGQRVLRRENLPLLKGQGRFVDDLPVSPRTLHAAFLRSPHPHAHIRSIDVSEALKQPGVVAVITGEDVAALCDPLIVGFANPINYYGIATDRVRYVGEPVAVVCASDRYKAEDALDFVHVDYEPLPAVVDPVEAAKPAAPLIHPGADSNTVSRRTFIHGEPEEAMEAAKRRSEITIRYPRNSITPMETYAIIAEYVSDTGGYDVTSNFQGPFSIHPVMAKSLRIPGSKLRHRSPAHSGGSFGSKLVIFPYIVVLCIAARKAGRPVKWIEDRLEHLSASSVAPNRVTRIEAGYDDDGVVSVFRMEHWDDHGAYLRAPMPAPIYRMHGLSTNCYRIGHCQVINNIMITNKCPTGAVRGFGGPQLYFAIERMMHKVAVELGLDPLEVIRRNLVPAGSFPYRAPAGALLDSGDYQRTIDETLADGGLAALKQHRDEARAEGRLYGIGYAAVVEPSQSNMGYISTLKTGEERERAGPKDGAVASATVSVDPVGSISVVGDSVPQGQGHQTALAQIVADELGVDIDDVVVNLETDTQKDNWSIASGNYSCRFAPAATSAAHLAAQRVREKLARIASQGLNVPPEELEFVDGTIRAKANPDNKVPFYRVAGLAHWSPSSLPEGMEAAVRETAHWNAPELTPTTANDEINTSLAYGFGFDYCGVEIDRDTGEVRIDKYVSAHDCGTILNPGLAEGQIHGSFAAAVGATLFEEFAYGEDGSFLSGTFADYLVITAPELPKLDLVHPTVHPSPYTRLGAKGIAEGNQYSTPVCVANAVADALGREDVSVPLTPAKVFEWIHGAETPPPGATTKPGKKKRERAIEGQGQALVPAPPEKVWATLLDPDSLATVIPGCRELEKVAENSYRASVDMGVGPVRGRFAANVKLSDLKPPRSARLSGDLSGPLGASRGSGMVTLEAAEGGTAVRYDYTVHLTGKVAAVGGRMLDGAARLLIGQFFKALVKQAAGGGK
jgi:2-furoyl-CoA dehydrogenase large subunit